MFSKSKTWSTLFTCSEETSLEMFLNLRRVILNQSKGLKMIEDKCLYRNWTLTLPARILLLSSTNCGFLKILSKTKIKHNIEELLCMLWVKLNPNRSKYCWAKGFNLFNFLDVWDKNTCCGWGSIGETAPAHHLYTILHLRQVQYFKTLRYTKNVDQTAFLYLFVLVLHHCGGKNIAASRGREKIF